MMIRLSRLAMIGAIFLGILLVAEGASLWNSRLYGSTGRFFTTPDVHRIPANGYFWTWGVAGGAPEEPDGWHFRVIFAANESGEVMLLWNLNESTLFSKEAAKMDEEFEVALPRANTAWRWDWVVKNPNTSALLVQNFTVIHFPITYPKRQDALVLVTVGLSAISFSAVAIAWMWRRNKPLRERNRFRLP